MHSARKALVIAVGAVALAATGCSGGTAAAGPGSATTASTTGAGATIPVVATTNVYASIVSAIGGDAVAVTAILADPSADPHSFEATPRTALDISKAAILVTNGGGYDDFATQLVAGLTTKPVVLDAVVISGLPTGGRFNEHVFYNLESMTKLSDALAAELSKVDPARAQQFSTNAATFDGKLAELRTSAAALGRAHPGSKAVVTEPVADYLMAAAGIKDVTPPGFSAAVEAETDPSVKDVAAIDQLLTSHTAALLVFNEQTSGPVTDGVQKVARDAGVPVVGVTETLPVGVTDYVGWMKGSIDALAAALGRP